MEYMEKNIRILMENVYIQIMENIEKNIRILKENIYICR